MTEFDYMHEDVENCPYYGTENDMYATVPICTTANDKCRHYQGGYCVFDTSRDSVIEPCKLCGCTTIQYVSAGSSMLAVQCVRCGARTAWFDKREHRDVGSLIIAVWNRGIVVNEK